MSGSPERLIVVLRKVLKSPPVIALAGAGALWALAIQGILGFGIFGLSLAGIAVYTTIKLRDDEFIREAFREQRDQQRKTDRRKRMFRIEELDVESRVKLKTIVKLQGEIAEDVVNSPVDEVAVGLAASVDQTDAVVERAMTLAERRRDLTNYLRKTDENEIERRIESLRHTASSELDPVRKSEIEMSLASKEKELADYRAIEEASKRVLSELDSIECSFASLKAKIVRIKSTDIAEWTSANRELSSELNMLTSAVEVVEQSINEALTIGLSE